MRRSHVSREGSSLPPINRHTGAGAMDTNASTTISYVAGHNFCWAMYGGSPTS